MNHYEKIKRYLNTCIEKNLLSHAYIFYGPDTNSRHSFSHWFVNTLLKKNNEKFHPDLFAINSEVNEEITIDMIHQLKAFLSLRPYSDNNKVAIIESAERLNSYAQDALLKTLEEAPGYAVIILSAKTIDSISDTIASRAVKLPFWQVNSGISLPEQGILDSFDNLLKTDFSDKYSCIEKFHKYNTSEIFEFWISFLETKFRADPTKDLFHLLTKSQNIYFKLNETNINPKLAYDELILSLWKI